MAASPPTAHAPGLRAIADRYRSLFSIGRGGMGSVEVALERGAGSFTRVVALKRMHPEGRDPRRVEMFLREARLAALLNHPNVVHAFDFGDIDGELFLAMEYVEGMTLSAVLKQAKAKEGGLVPALVAYTLAEVCDGLHAAHELRDPSGRLYNVVHRDISPHNVMVSFEGLVKLLDFGVAKMDTADGGLTRTGEVKGKAAYMSPEQAMGEKLDRRSDLYAIGAVLFECLAGRRMWGDGTDMETLRKLALEEPPSLASAVPSAPPALVDLHRRLVARDPAGRPGTAHEVAEELRAFVATTGTKPDASVVRAVMQRLFGDEIAARRKSLDDALGHAATTRLQVIRESFVGTDASSEEKMAAAQQSTVVDLKGFSDAPPTDESRTLGGAAANAATHASGTLTGYTPPGSGPPSWAIAAAVLVVMALAGVGAGVWWSGRLAGAATTGTTASASTGAGAGAGTSTGADTGTSTGADTGTSTGAGAGTGAGTTATATAMQSAMQAATASASSTATTAAGAAGGGHGKPASGKPGAARPGATGAAPATITTTTATATATATAKPPPKPVDTNAI
jgi:serine/threonine-protein kinase